jgi:hypothetical protein
VRKPVLPATLEFGYPGIFAIGAVGVLGLVVTEKVLKTDVPTFLLIVTIAICTAGLIGTIYIHGTGPPQAITPDSFDGERL